MRISDWSSDVCSSGLAAGLARRLSGNHFIDGRLVAAVSGETFSVVNPATGLEVGRAANGTGADVNAAVDAAAKAQKQWARMPARARGKLLNECRSEEHTSELQSLMRISYAVFGLKKKPTTPTPQE